MSGKDDMEVNLQEELGLLVELQDIDDQLRDLELERGDLPQEVDRLKNQVAELDGFLAQKQRRMPRFNLRFVWSRETWRCRRPGC